MANRELNNTPVGGETLDVVCEQPLRGDMQFWSQGSLDKCVLDSLLLRPG